MTYICALPLMEYDLLISLVEIKDIYNENPNTYCYFISLSLLKMCSMGW